ncbi:hypothetical protein BHE74_00024278 [Ensete ventricosum]|nr:hypothetical protein BHE74_00024278 [Ensete ventricosum]
MRQSAPGGDNPVDIRRHLRRGGKTGRVCCQPNPPPSPDSRIEIFFQIREKGLLKAPSPMKSHPEQCDKRRYCRFPREYEHDTEECRDLQCQIEYLIWRGYLRRYVCDYPFSLTVGPPETRLPDLRARSRSKLTSSSAARPQAATAPRREKFTRDTRSRRGRCITKTLTSRLCQEARSTHPMMMH